MTALELENTYIPGKLLAQTPADDAAGSLTPFANATSYDWLMMMSLLRLAKVDLPVPGS